MQTRRPRANMPRYPVEVLSDQEMADIYAYVSSISPGRSERSSSSTARLARLADHVDERWRAAFTTLNARCSAGPICFAS